MFTCGFLSEFNLEEDIDMPNEAVDRESDDQSIILQSGSQALPEAPAPPGPQPRPALTLVNGNREVSYENYECFIGVSPNVSDLQKLS